MGFTTVLSTGVSEKAMPLLKGITDLFKPGVIEDAGSVQPLTIMDFVITLGIAFVLGLFIYLIYRVTFGGVVFEKSFGTSLIMLSMVTAMVILPISTNLLLSLGMVGALSIVRFRTAVKEPTDTIYMFWSIAAGITLGARLYVEAVLASVLIGVLLIVWNLIRTKKNLPYILVIRFEDGCKKQVQEVLRRLPQGKLKSKIVSGGTIELTIEMNIKRSEVGTIDAFGAIDGVHDASLISYKGDVVS